MSSSFGGSAICPRCDKTVYQAEQIMGPGRKVPLHDLLVELELIDFSSTTRYITAHRPSVDLNESLALLILYDLQKATGLIVASRARSRALLVCSCVSAHLDQPDEASKSCHSKNFGTHNPGHRNVDPLLTPPRKVPIGVTLSESPKSTALETSPVNAVAERYATAAAIQRRHMTGDGIDSTSPRPIPRSLTGGSPSPRRTFGVDNPKCARCTKAVYFAEQVKAVGKIFHKGCLRCVECNTLLDSNRLRDHDGEPLCASCHTKLHGPQGLRK
ncbi:Cysteine and glycine-rich protein 3 [Mycena indigotica]|uniref:Cysteine-rich protein 1 n=1 Tax=Mycena indigotica TaxID=2126181 RepID=A0A8H6VWX5_9AGAR|nr:Cysteine and glycine-rich protein 3 [Mycena indigotica]KAF7297089.1 Cysteine and glycine-rich protein 3 [Mycena indigotica]